MLFCRSLTLRIKWSSIIAMSIFLLRKLGQRKRIPVRALEPRDFGDAVRCCPDTGIILWQLLVSFEDDAVLREPGHLRLDIGDAPAQRGKRHRSKLFARLLDMNPSATGF